ncbi:hypothetical protein G6F70_001760 [Rhizopus microsporus]|uniref:SWI5-dependent HO expression protein 3 n=2 Tax=Rhizopus TaxID=4842 RepID=A0A367KH45_RHIAZ|nr:hypothetical protein G6F71_002374 [Rhizopus microsporus]RCI01172.1 hypothetical protein CU097_015820 [Rhizopus azygosporus]KAG1203017.1 hypothetical protein G6F70_001760 [Rhizopus microsporus]KAG1216227.1 hypothetical protein G6F69_000281 [Rhizopus microsporus]KAG1235783.1 hypothetical protein G6F67_002499 [Rhizopus microsporus]
MLHIQDSFSHTSSLLMSPPIAVVVQPQPSTSSRTNKVLEQLSSKYEAIQNEISTTKAQLETLRQAKLQNEKDTQYYLSSNKVYRDRIKEIMQALESKQKLLDETKKVSSQLELKVKQLKDEALASRRQLEDLRKREQVLEHDRDVAVKEKNQLKHKHHLLEDSVEQLRDRCQREMALLEKDHSLLVEQAKYITERNELMMELINIKLKQRRQHTDNIALMKKQLQANTEMFVGYVNSLLDVLKSEIEKSATQTRDCTSASIQCRGEVNGLLSRIKTIAAEITASEK